MDLDVAQTPAQATFRRWKAWVVGLVLAVLYFLYGWRPFLVQAWTLVDQGLYIRQAEAFARWVTWSSRPWLGAWNSYLLAKAPLYGMWLGLIYLSGLPLRVAEFLLLIAGAVLFWRAVRPVRELRFWEFVVVLCVLSCNPMLPMDVCLARIGFQVVLSNLALIALLGLALRALAAPRERWRWAWLSGLSFSLCYLNREEAAWLGAAVVATFLVHWLTSFFAWRRGSTRGPRVLKGEVATLALFAAGALPLIVFVCAMNKGQYGAFTTTLRRSSALTALYQRLTSLEPAGHQRYVPIARATRMKAYALSPTFAKMKPFLEGKDGYWHAGNEHSAMNGHSAAEGEFFVSYFEFSLAWAAEKMGAKDAGQVEDIFRAIERELTQAVRDKKIVAGRSGPSILAAPVAGDGARLLAAFWQSLRSLLAVRLGDYAPFDGPVSSSAVMDKVAQLVHSSVKLPPKDSIQYKVRAPIVNLMMGVERVLYSPLVLVVPLLVVWKRRQAFTTAVSQHTVALWSGLVLVAGLLGFCFGMAVVEVLGFRFLAGMGYNVLGFAPLTVLCAFAFVMLLVFFPGLPRRTARSLSRERP